MIWRSEWLRHPRALAAARQLCEGFAGGDDAAVRAGAAGLAGLGEGSTPAGDDFLIGAMHALWLARPRAEALRLSAVAADVAVPRTTALSARWLIEASRGDASPVWRRLLNVWRQGHRAAIDSIDSIDSARAAVLRTGHTSGAAALAGFDQCLEAATRSAGRQPLAERDRGVARPIGAGLRGAVALALAAVAAAGCGRGDSAPRAPEAAASAPASWTPRPLRDVTFERTSARRDRGEYLVNGILQCFLCHSERDWTQAGAPPVEGREGAGAVWWNKPWLIAPNLTPDVETGIGRWSDDMLSRAIREGVSHDGRRLHPQMWSSSFSGLIDEDLASVVVYLRSLPPVRNPLPATVIPADVAKSLPPPPSLPPAPPDLSTPLGRGGYLATVADCAGCHTSWYTPRNPGLFGGGNLIERGDLKSYSSNLTSDPSGIAYYDAALFREVMRNGRLRGRTISPLMPWIAYRHLSDADLDALFAYLMAYRPVRHQIDNVAGPTACSICGGTHPLGGHNQPPEVTFVDYDVAHFDDAPGRYRLYPSFVLAIEVRDRRLHLRYEDGEVCELRTPDGRRFECKGGIDEIEFLRDGGGRIVSLLVNRADPGERIE